jgi:hydrogenase nickel incorporation protein HypB
MSQPRIVDVRQNVLKKNDQLARALRERFASTGVTVVSLVSSPGTLESLRRTHRIAALVGDLATDCDAARLARSGVPVRQITTGTVCHLEAEMVARALRGWDLTALDFLFIENVGNLVCPASYDLGEDLRVVMLSVTEGEEKPLKYPTIFNTADIVVLSKIDLAEPARFDRDKFLMNLRAVQHRPDCIALSAVFGAGMDLWIDRLCALRRERYRDVPHAS